MHRITIAGLAVSGLFSLAPVSTIAAQDLPSQDELRRLRQEMDEVRAENARMRSELNQIASAQRSDWLTEKRAEEIRAIVREVMEDVDARASFQNGLTAGWDRHFFLASPGGEFRLQVDGQVQTRAIMNHKSSPLNDNWRYGFELSRARLNFSGNVIKPEIEYLIQMDFTRNEPGLVTGLYFLRDAWIRYRLNDDWAVRAGQFKLAFNREELVSSARQLAVERTLLNETFNLGRSPGVELSWAKGTTSLALQLTNGAVDSFQPPQVQSGGGLNPTNKKALERDTEFAVTARWEELLAGRWSQFDDMTAPPGEDFGLLFGLAAHYQQIEWDRQFSIRENEVKWLALTADISAEWSGASLFASATYHYTDNLFGITDYIGFVVQGGWYVSDRVELFARYEYGHGEYPFPITASLTSSMQILTAGMNWYIDGHDLKLTTDVGVNLSRIGQNWAGGSNTVGQSDFGAPGDITGWRNMQQFEDSVQVVFRAQLQLLF
ncbi:MAG: hypothetical protein KF817_14725 [Phycisphaeraceae bacterium]|nr:hypothetical protein [Phycisphaeraceae bacterium]